MALRILGTADGDGVAREMKLAIEAAIDGASAEVEARGAGHYQVRVVSAAFAGKTPVQRQRMVYGAIGRFLTGDTAPVHAIDRMETTTPA
jgi:acid stress-induced BolA-like protein IbaG/YrbA